jgi:cytochrome P450
MQQGDMIIVLIAAANRDPALNPEPDRFDIWRRDRKYLELGPAPTPARPTSLPRSSP